MPSQRRRILISAVALLGIAAIVVIVVLPAERGVDITGAGRLIGLTEMGEIKQEIAAEIAADEALAATIRAADSADVADSIAVARAKLLPPESRPVATRSETTTVTIPAYGRGELMLPLHKNQRVSYSWSADVAPVDFLVIGDSNPAAGSYHLYNQANERRSKTGVIVAAFDGQHGWSWRSWTNLVVTIVLVTTY